MTIDRSVVDAADYCRRIETYLCGKNEGHLVRIVGPAFEQVCGWAERGVPLKVAFHGIDRYCERYYAKGPKRRPVRIEFCEADILDAFDDWRRAVGVTGPAAGASFVAEERSQELSRRPSLASHVERVISRLTALRAGGSRSEPFDDVLASTARELDLLLPQAKVARGEQRVRVVERLASMDRAVLGAAQQELDESSTTQLVGEAEAELAPFGARISPEARNRARDAAFERLVREAFGLPVLTYE